MGIRAIVAGIAPTAVVAAGVSPYRESRWSGGFNAAASAVSSWNGATAPVPR